MSENHEQRLSDVEREQVRQGERLGRIESDVGKIGAGVERLLERDAKRPQAMTFQTVAGTCVGLAAVAGVVWWLIGSAPAVQELRDRLSKLDDPDIGRVTRVEKELGWQPRVTRN
jgi:hypothetical protein